MRKILMPILFATVCVIDGSYATTDAEATDVNAFWSRTVVANPPVTPLKGCVEAAVGSSGPFTGERHVVGEIGSPVLPPPASSGQKIKKPASSAKAKAPGGDPFAGKGRRIED
jgi:hypothetical protein